MRVLSVLAILLATSAGAADLPTDKPQTAIFVTSCNQIVTAVLVMPNGKSLFFDSRSAVSADRIKELAATSREPARVYEVGCFTGEAAVGI